MKDSTLIQFKLLLPAALKRRVEEVAASNRRSLSQEIVATLEEKYPAPRLPLFQIVYEEMSSEDLATMRADIEQELRSREGGVELDASTQPEEPNAKEPPVSPDERLLDGRSLPLKPYLRQYGGRKPELIRDVAVANNLARLIADHVNTLAANNPDEDQHYSFEQIAQDLGLTVSQVRDAISDGKQKGVRVRLDKDARHSLEPFKRTYGPAPAQKPA